MARWHVKLIQMPDGQHRPWMVFRKDHSLPAALPIGMKAHIERKFGPFHSGETARQVPREADFEWPEENAKASRWRVNFRPDGQPTELEQIDGPRPADTAGLYDYVQLKYGKAQPAPESGQPARSPIEIDWPPKSAD